MPCTMTPMKAEPRAIAASRPEISLEFSRKPSVARYMLGAFSPSPGLSKLEPATRFSASWSGHRVKASTVERFLRLSGLPPERSVSILYPHVLGFPLHMAILTHPEFPVPIWRILQIRNDLLQHRPIDVGATLDFEVCVEAQRILERGAELDLRTLVRAKRELAWESLVTFYTRGRFGDPDPASPLAAAPDVQGEIVARWQMPKRGSWQFGQLTGDHNGIHHSDRYARLFGFRGALYHPPVVLGHCLSRVLATREGTARRFEAWLKGPVYRGSKVALRVGAASASQTFALFMERETRPSIVGRVTFATSRGKMGGAA